MFPNETYYFVFVTLPGLHYLWHDSIASIPQVNMQIEQATAKHVSGMLVFIPTALE